MLQRSHSGTAMPPGAVHPNRKPGLKLSLWEGIIPLGESRGGTPASVRAPLSARRIARCGGGYPAFAGVPLPSFIFVARVEQSETRERRWSRTFVPGFRCAQSGLRNGETGVANKETEAPPLSFRFLPGLRASLGRVLQRSGEEARRENA